jgi:hypothetical protein
MKRATVLGFPPFWIGLFARVIADEQSRVDQNSVFQGVVRYRSVGIQLFTRCHEAKWKFPILWRLSGFSELLSVSMESVGKVNRLSAAQQGR